MPVVLLTGYNVVKSIQFTNFRTLGNPITVSRVYDSRGVDELVLLDIRANAENRGPNIDIIADISGECFMPLTVGGGITNAEQVRELIRNGADEVAINTAAIERPQLVTELSHAFGAQCIVASIDYRQEPGKGPKVYSHSGKRATDLDPVAWARKMEASGAGEILLNSIDRDGKMQGFDLEVIRAVSSSVRIPVIACGGAGTEDHFAEAIQQGGAAAAAAASVFHFTSITPISVKEHLRTKGIPVRL
jgi:cyclase